MKQNEANQLKTWPAMRRPLTWALALAFVAGSVVNVGATASKANGSKKPNIVLVHGAWADGSCWSAVIQRLQEDGYNVIAPQFPLTSLANDVARLREVLAVQDGPTIVVGHSYGGQIITALGTDTANVVGLVYIAAFALDEGESIGGLLQQGPPPPAIANLRIDAQGFAWLPQSDFVNYFAADVDRKTPNTMYAVDLYTQAPSVR